MKRYLILEDGTVYTGTAFGADVSAIGELVFTTGMCGYIETLTDESYYGQIVLQTFPLIGNYGIMEEDFEGECCIKAYVVREACCEPSNFRCQKTLDAFLKEKGIPGICGIDTRAVTKRIREKGVMNAMVADVLPEDLSPIQRFSVQNAVSAVSCHRIHSFHETGRLSVALLDYGAKKNIIRELIRRDCRVTVFPADTAAEEILKTNPDGVMLSNGPGDPAENAFAIAQIQKMAGRVPIFGICLGHQLFGLALGAKTEKLKYGHRGVNQPVQDLQTKRTYITSQNHGYAVVSSSVRQGEIRFVNANDGTCEGIDYPTLRAFTVQFHPEACSGPHDTAFLFDRFLSLMEEP